MKKWLVLIVVVLAILAGWIAAGPFLTIHAIRSAVKEQNAAKLSQQIDFPALRESFRQQVDDYVVRRAGPEVQSSLLGALALSATSAATSGVVDVLATPAGLAAVMEGRNVWHRIDDLQNGTDAYTPSAPRDPLEGAHYHFESLSRFTATVNTADGQPVVFVLSRQGFTWKVTEVRLPFTTAAPMDGD